MLPEPDPALLRLLAEDLADAGFEAGAVRAAWGPIADDAVGRGLRLPAVRAIADRAEPLAVLARVFVLGMTESAAAVDSALPRVGAAGVQALGLGRVSGDTLSPGALIRPQAFTDTRGSGHWWIASDLDEAARGGPLPEDHVLGVGGASLTLAGLQLPRPAQRAFDVGTGCGIQSLRARRDVDTVVATDISERALRYTRLNALLNGVDGVETRAGSMFAPVSGERFDRIVSNPPFVITPRVDGVPAYEYRDGGMAGDDLVAAFVRDVGEYLEPGGVAQLLGNWETQGAQTGLDRVRRWVAESEVPLDAWVVERESIDPLSYAELWVRDGGTAPGAPAYASLIEAWLEDFAARGVTEIGFGYVLLRRPSDGTPSLERYESITHAVPDGLGQHVVEAIDAHDRLSALNDTALAASVLMVAPDVTEARHHVPGHEDPSVIELRQGGGFARSLSVDPALAALVGASDGDLPVGALVDAIADLLGVDAGDLRADTLPRIRELLFTGFLAFADVTP